MRTVAVVIPSPGFDPLRRIRQVPEPARVQTLISELPIEALHEGVLDRLAGLDEVELDATLVSPLIERTTREFRAVIRQPSEQAGLQDRCVGIETAPGEPERESDRNLLETLARQLSGDGRATFQVP